VPRGAGEHHVSGGEHGAHGQDCEQAGGGEQPPSEFLLGAFLPSYDVRELVGDRPDRLGWGEVEQIRAR
jgi:hypothetical protein